MSSSDTDADGHSRLQSFERKESWITAITEDGLDLDDSAFDDCDYESIGKIQSERPQVDARAKHKYNVLSRLVFW